MRAEKRSYRKRVGNTEIGIGQVREKNSEEWGGSWRILCVGQKTENYVTSDGGFGESEDQLRKHATPCGRVRHGAEFGAV